MANIYDELKHLASGDMLSKLTGSLGVNHAHAESLTGKLLPTILSKFMTKSDSPSIMGVLKDAATGKKGMGEKFLSTVMGSQESTLNGLVAGHDGMSAPHAKALTAGIGGLIATFLGKRILQHGSPKHVMDELASEKNAILAGVPAEWKEKFHLSADTMHCAAPAHKASAAHAHSAAPKKKSKLGWLWWLLGLIVLALLLCLLLGKGCKGCAKKDIVPVVAVDTLAKKVVTDTYELTLPTGEKLTVRNGGMIDKMVKFLESDEYKKGTEDTMRKHWFEFEDVDFKYDSSTEFEPGTSVDQIENRLVFLMKYFPEAQIRFGGDADKKGQKGYNQTLSEARAKTIEKMMIAKGIAPARISTRGFGDENAVIPATATDAERAPDRDFAVRFRAPGFKN